jgi:hypothetical protein
MRLYFKTIFLFLSPIFLLVSLYVWTDPFKVIYSYDNYLCEYVMLDRGFVSTQVFLNNNDKYHFNSFIFGSSRSCAYTSSEWEKHLPDGSRAYSFEAWNETIQGILKKLQFINISKNEIRNALLIIDTDYTFGEGNSLEYEHFLISGKPISEFHLNYFSEYLKEYWLIPMSVDYKLFRKKRSYMKGFIGMKPGDLDPVNNDWLPSSELEILQDSVAYYKRATNIFYKRSPSQQESPIRIGENELATLQEINHIFKTHNTNVKIIIGPLYDEVKFNHNDLLTLQKLFGTQNVYDYSGINELTSNIYSFANDVKHYRKRTANKIMSFVYSPQHLNQ